MKKEQVKSEVEVLHLFRWFTHTHTELQQWVRRRWQNISGPAHKHWTEDEANWQAALVLILQPNIANVVWSTQNCLNMYLVGCGAAMQVTSVPELFQSKGDWIDWKEAKRSHSWPKSKAVFPPRTVSEGVTLLLKPKDRLSNHCRLHIKMIQ